MGGGRIVEGRAAIDEFYRRAVTMVDCLERVAPIRTSNGAFVVMAFDIQHCAEGGHPPLLTDY